MLSKLRKRHGDAFPVAVLALVVAVAFAGVPAMAQPVATASNALAKQVKQALNIGKAANKRSVNAIKLARQANNKAGQAGPAGPQGLPGPAGEQGPKGDPGKDGVGTQGTAGKSVEVSATSDCDEGGVTVQVVGEPATAQEICNGEEGLPGATGSPWTAGGTLPSEETLTGTFAFIAHERPISRTPISFPIPLAAELPGSAVHVVSKAQQDGSTVPAACTVDEVEGSVANPLATPGNLCVYIQTTTNVAPSAGETCPIGIPNANSCNAIEGFGPVTSGSGVSGAILWFTAVASPSNATRAAHGTWAVTAPVAP